MRLETLTVEDFRSIGGSHTFDLSASVVLVHGTNGAGKTSFLSALELALTGDIPSLRRTGEKFLSHIPHRNAARSRVAITGMRGDRHVQAEFTIEKNRLHGTALLPDQTANWYSERGYLAQSMLGRLLDIYSTRVNKKGESPLTTFVNELLGLDQLDAIIAGLHPATDLRKLKTFFPEYKELADKRDAKITTRQELQNEIRDVNAGLSSARQQLMVIVNRLGSVAKQPPTDAKEFRESLGPDAESSLQSLARARRQLAALQTESQISPSKNNEQSIIESMRSLESAEQQLTVWRNGSGKKIQAVIKSLQSLLPEIPDASLDPRTVCLTVIEKINAECQKIARVLDDYSIAQKRLSDLKQTLAGRQSELNVLNEKILSYLGANSELLAVLVQLLPFIDSDECPVCLRDFSQVSPMGLQSAVAVRVAGIRGQVEGLQKLTGESRNQSTAITLLNNEIRQLFSGLLLPERVDQLKQRASRLEAAKLSLETLKDPAAVGSSIIQSVAELTNLVTLEKSRDAKSAQSLEALRTLAAQLDQPVTADGETIAIAINRLLEHVDRAESALMSRQLDRNSAMEKIASIERLEKRLRDLTSKDSEAKEAKEKIDNMLKSVTGRKEVAKNLVKEAERARDLTIRKVFNEALNDTWQSLFGRLAPQEVYLPAFSVPSSGLGRVEAILETVDRDTRRSAGTPGAMLSAGNLNTAALTLFLALHFSIKSDLPVLVIDDPVQNMDEIHIAQFAALLRVLSRQNRRQIILAVHDRALFDYLALELSPATEGETLVTFSLDKDGEEKSTVDYQRHIWREDRAIH